MSACRPYLYMAAGCFTKMHGILHAEKRKPMGKIHNVEKMTDNRFVNLYHVDATSIHNTPVSYYVASRAKDVPSLKLKTSTAFTEKKGTKSFWCASTAIHLATIFMNFRQVW